MTQFEAEAVITALKKKILNPFQLSLKSILMIAMPSSTTKKWP